MIKPHYRRWRVKTFNGRSWCNHRYYDDDLKAFKDFCVRRVDHKQAVQLNIQLRKGGNFINPGGCDNLLWISAGRASYPFGESREYWEDILKQATDYAKTIKSKEIKDESK